MFMSDRLNTTKPQVPQETIFGVILINECFAFQRNFQMAIFFIGIISLSQCWLKQT